MDIEYTTAENRGSALDDIRRSIEVEKKARARISALHSQADIVRKRSWGEALELKLKAAKIERALRDLREQQAQTHSPAEHRRSIELFEFKLKLIEKGC